MIKLNCRRAWTNTVHWQAMRYNRQVVLPNFDLDKQVLRGQVRWKSIWSLTLIDQKFNGGLWYKLLSQWYYNVIRYG
jgi:hypothetical protein